MAPRFLLPSVLLLLSGAQAFQYSGRVVDSAGVGQRRIGVVHLPSGLSTTTDSAGAWTLSGTTTGVPARAPSARTAWDGRILQLELDHSSRVEVSVRDARGVRHAGLSPRTLAAGVHRFDLGSLARVGSTRWLVLRVDGRETILAPGAARTWARDAVVAGRSAEGENSDRVAYLVSGDTVAIEPVSGPVDTGRVRRIDRLGLQVRYRIDPRIALDSIVLWVAQEGTTRLRRFKVEFDPRYDLHGHTIRVADLDGGARPRGRFWARLYGNGGGTAHRLVGISDTGRFESWARALPTPSFGQSNALPLGDLVGPAAAPVTGALGVYTTYRFEAARSDETIVQYEWDLAGSGFQVGADSIQAGFSRPGPRILQVRTTDNEGNQAVTRFRIQAGMGRRKVVASVVADTVTPGDVVEMAWGPDSATAVDTVIWNVEGTNLDTTLGKGPGHRFAYAVLGTDSLPVGSRTSRRFSVKRHTVDGRGAWRFANIEVVNDRPVVRIERSASSTADLTILDVIATDRGDIGTVEWSTTGASVVDITSSRQIRIPASLAATATITVRVRDEDLNDTQVTWKAAP